MKVLLPVRRKKVCGGGGGGGLVDRFEGRVYRYDRYSDCSLFSDFLPFRHLQN